MSDELETGIIEIHGKQYHTVAKRLRDFRDDHPDWTIKTKVLSAADLVQTRTSIYNESGRLMATGHAEEKRGETKILSTSPVEVCETSSCGRAMAFLGYQGTSIATAEEMENALAKQAEAESIERLQAHNEAVRENIESIVTIKAYLMTEEYGNAYEAWQELTEEDKRSLWVAPSKGGIFTTRERAQLKSDEMNQARKDYHGGLNNE